MNAVVTVLRMDGKILKFVIPIRTFLIFPTVVHLAHHCHEISHFWLGLGLHVEPPVLFVAFVDVVEEHVPTPFAVTDK